MTVDELAAYVRDTLACREQNVADWVNTGRAFITAVLAARDQQD